MAEKSLIFKELMSASVFLAFVTSLLYIAGASYIDSYLAAWGIEASLIENNMQQVLMSGAEVCFIGGIYIVIFSVLFGVMLFAPVYFLSEFSKSPFVRRVSSKIYEMIKPEQREELEPPAIFQLIIRLFFQFFALIVICSFLLFLFYRLLDFSSSQAKIRAEQEYQEFSSGIFTSEGLFSKKKELTINGKEFKGYILANSDSFSVLYLLPADGEQEQVRAIPLGTISNIKSIKNNKINVKSR